MFEWKVENLVLRNENKDKLNFIYSYENKLTKEEKIEFVDKYQNGKLSYIINLVNKFNEDKKVLPKDSYGHIKTVSLIAWIKRNDKEYGISDYSRIVDAYYHYGQIRFLRCERWITEEDFLSRKSVYDLYDDYVDEIFHRQLLELLKQENEYFKTHDEYELLKSELQKKYSYDFGLDLGFCSDGNIYIYDKNKENKRKLTLEELKTLVSKCDEINKVVKELQEKIKNNLKIFY